MEIRSVAMVRLVGRCAIAAVLVALSASPGRAQTDHLQCFKIKDSLSLAGVVDLASDVSAAAGCKVSKAKLFCAPASKTVISADDKQTGKC